MGEYKFVVSNSEFVSQYEYPTAVIRRGETLEVFFPSSIEPADVTFELSCYGERMKVGDIKSEEMWRSSVEKQWNSTRAALIVPTSAQVGLYNLGLRVCHNDSLNVEFEFLCVFNPWNQFDETYMKGTKKRYEYVLNESVIICYGNSKYVGQIHWKLEQFSKDAVATLLFILRKHCNSKERSNAALLSRKITQLVNSNDDRGILVGNWGSDFSAGTAPTSWKDSVSILREYNRYNNPVKYGQCFTFAAINATLLRTVGIPARVVTNINSIHDGDKTTNFEVYFDQDGTYLENYSHDSMWNFHVWNEVLFKRGDINEEYNGWNVVDATPQERSSNRKFTCGPIPVKAIKAKDLSVPYDAPFVFAEMNGKKVYYQRNKFGKFEKIHEEDDIAGTLILTKAVGSKDLVDLRMYYKPEVPIDRVIAGGPYESVSKSIHFDISAHEKVFIGDDMTTTFNYWSELKIKAVVKVTIFSVTYDGKIVRTLKKFEFDFSSSSSTTIVTSAGDLYKELTSNVSAFKVVAILNTETEESSYAETVMPLESKKLVDILSASTHENEKCKMSVKVRNTLPFTLTNCRFVLSSPMFVETKVAKINDLPPASNGIYDFHIELNKMKSSRKTVSFNASIETSQVNASSDEYNIVF